jgi:hypothetical protein
MFGQNTQPQDDALIPDQAIEGALNADANDTGAIVSPVSNDWQHPGTPLDAPQDTQTDDPTTSLPTMEENSEPVAPAEPAPASPLSDDLMAIKQHALTELTPLVDHLEQSPEEKFRTTMMMIQASDDQSLVRVAYEAALAIEDEKTKAQALLDVINEINYFTHPGTQSPEA